MKNNLISFFGGVFFTAFTIPLINEITAILGVLSECVQTKLACLYYADAKKLQEAAEPEAPEETFAIGFQAPDNEYEEVDEDV